MDRSLQQYERDVETARSKLTADLDMLRSPETMSSFTDSLKQKALEAKDVVVDQAKDAVQSKVTGFVDDLKAKAAANPAAALTIGAGIAWHVLRHPPIATALIGAGLFSLWRSQGVPSDRDYFEQGKQRLQEQASEFGESAMNVASDIGVAISDKAAVITDAAKEKVADWSNAVAESAGQAGEAVKVGAQAVSDGARRLAHDVRDEVADAGAAIKSTIANTRIDPPSPSEFYRHEGSVNESTDLRDNVLLGVAGLAVAAALGIAYQKRVEEAEVI